VEEVFLKLDRKHFVENNPYEDSPQPIGFGATISAPHMHAAALVIRWFYITYKIPGTVEGSFV
jgi:protein-L-isoaspartate(D-aspartate) O-methyltransferase